MNPQSGDRILDVDWGTGHALVEIGHRVGAGGLAPGVDMSAGMLYPTRHDDSIELIRPLWSVSWRGMSGPSGSRTVEWMKGGGYLAETLELFDGSDIAISLGELARVLDPVGRLCVTSMPRTGLERLAFVRAYECLYRHVPGDGAVGCRPIDVERAIRRAGIEIDRTVRMRRLLLGPIEIVTPWPRRNKGH